VERRADLPSGSFAANSAWLVLAAIAFNLPRWAAEMFRRRARRSADHARRSVEDARKALDLSKEVEELERQTAVLDREVKGVLSEQQKWAGVQGRHRLGEVEGGLIHQYSRAA
jgi:hypothetical protein